MLTIMICHQVQSISNFRNVKMWKKWVLKIDDMQTISFWVRIFKIITLIFDYFYLKLHLGLEYWVRFFDLLYLGISIESTIFFFIPHLPQSTFLLKPFSCTAFLLMPFGTVVLVWMLVSSLCLFLWFKSLYY